MAIPLAALAFGGVLIGFGTTVSEASTSEASTDSEETVFTCAEDYGVARVIYDIDRRAPVAFQSEIVDDLYFFVLQMFGEDPTTGIKAALGDVEVVHEDAETIVYVAAEGAVEFGLTKINDTAVPQYLAVCGSLAEA